MGAEEDNACPRALGLQVIGEPEIPLDRGRRRVHQDDVWSERSDLPHFHLCIPPERDGVRESDIHTDASQVRCNVGERELWDRRLAHVPGRLATSFPDHGFLGRRIEEIDLHRDLAYRCGAGPRITQVRYRSVGGAG